MLHAITYPGSSPFPWGFGIHDFMKDWAWDTQDHAASVSPRTSRCKTAEAPTTLIVVVGIGELSHYALMFNKLIVAVLLSSNWHNWLYLSSVCEDHTPFFGGGGG